MTVSTVNIPETWQSGVQTWSTYRNIQGPVTFTLTDVEGDDGTWQYVTMSIKLLDSSGTVYGSGTVTKYWGEDATTGLGDIYPGRNLCLQTYLYIVYSDGWADDTGSWTATVSWNNSIY